MVTVLCLSYGIDKKINAIVRMMFEVFLTGVEKLCCSLGRKF